ncbi:hypothetical protein T09_5326 [Trichinella sp. T9]|uniref:Uncharacterized protein n=1 Tax=Trichinella murrelli TaxID=144512 RepID=A0A0V0TMY0_9BILA|nr:hypothetical protein T05_7618 [Trichinella murrelli]KRX57396.1 hypothetical protein T09_5326 [Trichinella sp. T9]
MRISSNSPALYSSHACAGVPRVLCFKNDWQQLIILSELAGRLLHAAPVRIT